MPIAPVRGKSRSLVSKPSTKCRTMPAFCLLERGWQVDSLAGTRAPASKGEQIVRDERSARVTKEHTVSVTVDVIDLPNMMLTVKDDKGSKSSFRAKDKDNLRYLKIGNKVDMTYTEGLLIKADPGQ